MGRRIIPAALFVVMQHFKRLMHKPYKIRNVNHEKR